MPWRGILRALRLLPQGALSRGFGHIADIPIPRPLRGAVLSSFASMMGIDVTEAELPIDDYGSINEFFVRRLRTGARTIDGREGHIVSPVDGVVGQRGTVQEGELLQAKGRVYSVASLLDDDAAAESFLRGSFLTIYLSPRHYHRIHAPVTGSIGRADHIPGALLPVNEPSVQHIEKLFPRNERLLCYIAHSAGKTAVVAVGAYNVGRISAAFDSGWQNGASVTNRRGDMRSTRTYDPPVQVKSGDEIMAFHLGSTIVMVFDTAVKFADGIEPGAEVKMGSTVAVHSQP